jgi:hypothetical protein
MDNEPGAQVHEVQLHLSVKQSEDAAHNVPMADSADSVRVDAVHNAPMDDGTNSVWVDAVCNAQMDDSANPMQVPDINAPAEPFQFGNLAHGLFNW